MGPWSFHCSACGKCCNSAPEMSLPELLDHQELFVGVLAIRRVPNARVGDPLVDGAGRLEADDVSAIRSLADALTHRTADPAADRVLLTTLALTPPSATACPALGLDGRCTLHDGRKPQACQVVPLDARWPDRLQHAVLAARRADAVYVGAECVLPGRRPGALPIVEGHAPSSSATAALARHREDLRAGKRWWGDFVFALLRRDLVAGPSGLGRVPADGYLVVAIAPVILSIAAWSARCKARCIAYVEAQIALIDALVRRAEGGHREPGASDAVDRLRAFARTHRGLRTALACAPPRAVPPTPEERAAVEGWLGLP